MRDYKNYFIEYLAGRMPKWKPPLYYLFDVITSVFIPRDRTCITNPKKILIIRNDHIGDLISSTSVFREIKRAYPKAKITLLASKVTKSLVEKNKHIDKIITLGILSETSKMIWLKNYIEVFRKIKKEEHDVGIDLRGSLTNIILLLWLPRIKMRIAYYNITGGKAFLTKPVLFDKLKVVRKIFLDLVKEGLNFETKNYTPEIATDREDEIIVERYIKSNKLKKFICIAPSSEDEWKAWPLEKFKKLIGNFLKDYPDYKILLLGGGNDEEKIKKLLVDERCMPLINFNLRQLSLILKKSQLLISNDSGIKYLAWASGAKSIAILGPLAALQSSHPLKNSIPVIDKSYDIKNVKISRVEKEIKKILR